MLRLLLAALLLAPLAATAQPTPSSPDASLAGTWDGAIEVGGAALPIAVTFTEGDALTATIDIPQQGARGLALENVRHEPPAVYFELPAGPGLAVFDGTHDGDTIAGTFAQGAASGTFSITRQDAPDADTTAEAPASEGDAEADAADALPEGVLAEDVALDTPTGTLYGTLTLPPEAAWPAPAVLVVAGSGPTDRDGNSAALPGENNSLRMLAHALSANGYAVLRVDKRGVAASQAAAVTEADHRLGTYVDDAVAWGERLRDDDRTAGPLVVIGHSEGALVGALAADRLDADALVALAGLGRPIQDVLRRQLAAQLPPALVAEADSILAALEAGETVDEVPPALAPVFRPSVQPYLRSAVAVDPAAAVADLDAPVLVVNGTTDVQVTPDDGARLANAENATLVTVVGMNHVLKAVEGDLAAQLPSYSDAALPLHPDLLPALLEFLGGLEE